MTEAVPGTGVDPWESGRPAGWTPVPAPAGVSRWWRVATFVVGALLVIALLGWFVTWVLAYASFGP